MEENNLNDIQIGNVDNFVGSKDQNYSRSMLLMKATSRVLEAGSREMKQGFYVEKRDKFGNIIKLLTDDTRKAYCESVQTLRDLQTCDFEEEDIKEIEDIEKEIEDKKQELLTKEIKEWNGFNKSDQSSLIKKGFVSTLGSFNVNKRFHEQFILFSLKKHRELYQVLTKFSKDKEFYGSDSFES